MGDDLPSFNTEEYFVSGSVVIYGLKDPRDERVRYVGKTQNSLVQRLYEHSQETRKRIQKGNLTPKHEWIDELKGLGLEPEVKVLEECSSNDWETREKYWIVLLPDLLNLMEGGHHGAVGYKHSEETKAKISIANLGRVIGPPSKKTRAKLRVANLGKLFSEETRAKMSTARLGKVRGPHSKETKAKISATHLGKVKGPPSEETRAKIRAALIGKVRRPPSEETKAKLRAANLGKLHSEETKAKMSTSQKRRRGVLKNQLLPRGEVTFP